MDKDTQWIIGILAVVVIGYLWMSGGESGVSVTTDTGVPYISTGATNLSFIGSNALELGTAVSLTTQVSVDDGAFKSTVSSASPGNSLDLLFTATGYHSEYLENQVVPKAPRQTYDAKLYANASASIVVFNINGELITDPVGEYSSGPCGGGRSTCYNQTVSSGGTYNMKIRLDGQDKKSTNPMRCILEASNGTAMKSMTLSGLGAVFKNKEKPSSYALNGSDSEVWVYDIDAITGAVSPGGTIGVQSETGMSLADSRFKIDCYTKESFIDTETGDVMVGIEDSQGTLQSLAHYQFTGNFAT